MHILGLDVTGFCIVDGENVTSQETVENETMIWTVVKEGDKYYTFDSYNYWKSYAHPIYNWGDYYCKNETTEENRDGIKYQYKDIFEMFEVEYSDFEWDKDCSKYVATGLTSSFSDGEMYTLTVGFDENNRLSTINLIQEGVEDANSYDYTFEYGDMTVTAPVGVVTYPMSNNQSEFELSYENYVCTYEEYSMGYVYPTSFKIEKAGNTIRLSEKSSIDDDFRTPTYYDKEGNTFYKYVKSGEVWSKVQIDEAEYSAVVNKVKNAVVKYNNLYSFANFADSSYDYYYISGASGGSTKREMLSIFCVDYKVEKIVVGPMLSSADKGPLAQFNFEYYTPQIVLPQI
jgi:hypothetical protein